jgi:hypothetical protein
MGPGNKCRDDSFEMARANLFSMRCVEKKAAAKAAAFTSHFRTPASL